jgi:hypothetical protein
MNDRMQELSAWVDASADEVLAFLESPGGRRLRKIVATGLIVSVPLLLRLPGLRSSPIGRLLEVTGGAALVVKLAELIRDWERDLPAHQVVDVPRVD